MRGLPLEEGAAAPAVAPAEVAPEVVPEGPAPAPPKMMVVRRCRSAQARVQIMDDDPPLRCVLPGGDLVPLPVWLLPLLPLLLLPHVASPGVLLA